MTRAPAPSPARKPAAALCLHRVGSSYVYAIVSTGTGQARVVDSGRIPVADEKALESLRQKAGSGAVVAQIVPASSSVLRAAPPKLVLDGTPEQIASSLELVAEAELPSWLPAHRRSAGVIRAGKAHAVYAVGWLERSEDQPLVTGAVAVPALAALSALFKLSGEPHGVAAWADQPTGTIAMIAAGRGESPGLMARQLVDDPDDSQSFAQVLAEAIDDARAALGLDAPELVGPRLLLPARPQGGLGASGDDVPLAVGGAIFAIEARPDEATLLRMSQHSPSRGVPITRRIAAALSSPRAAVTAAYVCLGVLLIGWALAAPIKLAILQNRIGDDDSDYTKAVAQHEWYKSLRDRRWPMTALIAELSAQAPEGVRIESLSIEHGRPVTFTGSADSAASIEAWCQSLRGKIFTDVKPNIPAEDVTPVRFTITASVGDPLLAAVSELKPLASSEVPRTRSDSPAGGSGTRADRNTRSGPSGRTNPGSNSGSGNAGRAATPPATAGAAAEPPSPMTDAQIERLAAGPATIEWAKRKGQLTRTDLDDTTRRRLEAELTKIEARRKVLGGGQ